MNLPNFLIIGTAKAGTTSLYNYLNQHPEIYMSPRKELNFFTMEGMKIDFNGPGDEEVVNTNPILDIKTYKSYFEGVANEKAVGEASTWYLFTPKAAERIHHHIPDVKLIVILRNPVDRAYSSFLHMKRNNREPCTNFSQALKAEKKRIQENYSPIWFYQSMGFYYSQLKRYYDYFKPDQMRIYLYDEFCSNTHKVLQDIFNFLEVDEAFMPDFSLKYNVTGIPKNKFLNDFFSNPSLLKSIMKSLVPKNLRKDIVLSLKNKNLEKPELSLEMRQMLLQDYRKDIINLQDLIKKDLSIWLKK